MNQKAHMAYNIESLIKTKGLLKVIGSHVYCKCGSISKTMRDRDVVTTDH